MIKRVSQNIYKELSTAPVNWLLANVGDKLRIETTFTVETYAVSSLDNPISVNFTDGMIGSGWIYDPQGQFKDFRIGDTVSILDRSTSATWSKTIVDKLDDYKIQLNSALEARFENQLETNIVFTVTTPITGIKYRYNFIENNEADNFNSKVDGSDQLLICEEVDAGDTTVLDMIFFGNKEYQIGSATIEGVSIDTGSTDGVYKSTFKIIHYTYLTPFILASELNGEGASTLEPEYFKNGNCLKFIVGIDALYEFTDPNGVVSGILSDVLGDTGWRDENFNQGNNNYYVDTLVYQDDDGVLPGIKLSSEKTSVYLVIKNTVDAPFNNNTKFVLNFVKAPFTEAEYQDNDKTLDENFLFDRALQEAAEPPVNGDQFGTDRQVITNLVAIAGTSSSLTIEFDIELGSDVLDNLNASESPSYRLFLSIQDEAIATKDSDLVTLFIDDYNQFYINTTDDGMIINEELRLLRHPEGDIDNEGISNVTVEGTSANKSIALVGVSVNITSGDLGYADDAIGTNFVSIFDLSTSTLVSPIANQAALNAWIASLTPSLPGWTLLAEYVSGTVMNLSILSPDETGANFNGKFFYADSVSFDAFTFIPGAMSGGVNEVPADILECFPEDEIVACTKFYIDRDGREDDDIVITSVQNKIIAKNTVTDDYFVLDGCTVNTSFYPKVGEVQYINAQLNRDFHVPADTIRKAIHLYRRIDLDSGDKYYYQFNFPFLFRWETWVKLVSANSDFFNNTQSNNGLNHWWFHYYSGDWKIYNRVIINATKNGVTQQYTQDNEIIPHDYNSNSDWTTKNIKTYNEDGSVELYDGVSKRFIFGDANTLVKANFTKNATPAGVTVEIKMEVWEQGGYYGQRVYSSRWEADDDTWFTSTDGSGKVVLTPSGNSIEAKCLIDFSLIPTDVVSYKISARIYDGTFGLMTDDGIQLTTDDGAFITVD